MSSVSVVELWWMDRRIATRDVATGDRMRRPQARDLRLLSSGLADALGNAQGARFAAGRHRAKGNDGQADRWHAESQRQAAIAEALQSAIAWLRREATNLAAFDALLRKISDRASGPLKSNAPKQPGPHPPPLSAGAATPRAPTFGGASVAA